MNLNGWVKKKFFRFYVSRKIQKILSDSEKKNFFQSASEGVKIGGLHKKFFHSGRPRKKNLRSEFFFCIRPPTYKLFFIQNPEISTLFFSTWRIGSHPVKELDSTWRSLSCDTSASKRKRSVCSLFKIDTVGLAPCLYFSSWIGIGGGEHLKTTSLGTTLLYTIDFKSIVTTPPLLFTL